MSEEGEVRVILIVSAIVAALIVHRVESSHADTLSLYPPSVVTRR